MIFKKINNLVWKLDYYKKIIYLICLLIIVFILDYFFCLKHYISDKKLLHNEIVDLRAQLISSSKMLQDKDISLEMILKQKKNMNFSKNTDAFLIVLAIINGQMLPQYLIAKSMNFVSIKNRTAFIELMITVSLEGNEKNIKAFLYQIANLRYPIFLADFEWYFLHYGRNKFQSECKINLGFKIFTKDNLLFNHNYVQLFKKKILNSNYLHPNLNYLIKYPLKQIKLVGIITQKFSKKWGLVKLPDSQFCKVKLNNELGIERLKITFIGINKIVLESKKTKKIIKIDNK